VHFDPNEGEAMNVNATTQAGAVDLLGSLVGDAVLTNQAAKSADLRWCWGDPNQPSSAFRDYRFGAGLLATGVGMVSKGQNRRLAFGAASASLHSFVGTETMRRAAYARQAQQYQQAPQQYQQIPQQAQPGAFGPPVYPQQLPGPQAYPQQPQPIQQVQFMPGMFR
jgi:hypothetical protein